MMIVPVLCFLTLYNLIVNSLLTGDDDVKLFFACLEPLWHWLDPSIPVQHVQDPILCVSCVIQGFNTGYFEMSKDTFVFYIIHVVHDHLLVNFIMSFHINSDQCDLHKIIKESTSNINQIMVHIGKMFDPRIQFRIFSHQVSVHFIISCVEIINIWLVQSGSR